MKSGIAGAYDQWIAAFSHYDDKPGVTADEVDPIYYSLQQSVPPGEPLLVMLEKPYRLDFRRNRIMSLDIPGAVSPAPGIPILDGPEEVAGYLLGKSIRYVAFIKETASFELYQRAAWERQASGHEKKPTRTRRRSTWRRSRLSRSSRRRGRSSSTRGIASSSIWRPISHPRSPRHRPPTPSNHPQKRSDRTRQSALDRPGFLQVSSRPWARP